MLSIIIPAYNEEKRIKPTLEDYTNFFKNKDAEILVILNGCTDNTLDVVKSFKNVKYKDIKEPIGKGAAILEGMKLAKGDFVSFVDADNAVTPDQLYHIFNQMKDCDVAFGSRYMKGSVLDRKRLFSERFGAKSFNILIKLVLNLQFKDTQCGAKIFKRNVIEKVLPNLVVSRWAFDISLLYSAKRIGFRLKEVPIRWVSKNESKFNMFKSAPGMFLTLLKLRFSKP